MKRKLNFRISWCNCDDRKQYSLMESLEDSYLYVCAALLGEFFHSEGQITFKDRVVELSIGYSTSILNTRLFPCLMRKQKL